MAEFADGDHIGQENDDPYSARLGEGEQPDHHRDQPAGEDAFEHHNRERVFERFVADLVHGVLDVGVKKGLGSERPGEKKGAEQVCNENDHPEAEDIEQHLFTAIKEQGKDGGERVLGEKLLAAKDDDEESGGIAQV